MRAVLFILKLGLKILAVPVVLALTLFTWLCFWLLYVSSFIFGLVSTVVALLGIAVLVTYSPQNGVILLVIYGFSAVFTYVEHFIMATVTLELSRDMRQGPADGCRLAGGQGAGPAVCDPGRGVWLNRKRRIAGSECPAIF